MTLGLLDLSIVTDRLIAQLKAYRDASKLWEEDRVAATPGQIHITGVAPDVARDEPGCQLSIYLFHVAVDKAYRNTHPAGGSARTTSAQPLALTLFFLVTAHSDSKTQGYVDEQQAMSIALKFFHENPRIVATVPLGDRKEELTISFEPQTVDELGRLWQAMSSPLRLSAVYRAAVAFLEPTESTPPKPVLALPDLAAEPLGAIPPPGEIPITIDADGFATITGEGFATGATTVAIRALALPETSTVPAGRGRFRVVSPTELEVRIPDNAPSGRYVLRVNAAPGKPTRELWLVVP